MYLIDVANVNHISEQKEGNSTPTVYSQRREYKHLNSRCDKQHVTNRHSAWLNIQQQQQQQKIVNNISKSIFASLLTNVSDFSWNLFIFCAFERFLLKFKDKFCRSSQQIVNFLIITASFRSHYEPSYRDHKFFYSH